MACYKILWGSRYCRDCGAKATTKWPLCACENDSPKSRCTPLSLGDRQFCEHCGGVDPGDTICPHCDAYPLDLPQWRRVMLMNRSLRLSLPVAILAVPLVLAAAVIGLSMLVPFGDNASARQRGRYGAAAFFFSVLALLCIGYFQKQYDIRKSRTAFRMKHEKVGER